MYKVDYPFEACEECTCIDDCPHPEVQLDEKGVCLPVPPDVCPRPLKIALTKRKRNARMDNKQD